MDWSFCFLFVVQVLILCFNSYEVVLQYVLVGRSCIQNS